MLNYIWAGMILLSIAVAAVNGTMPGLTAAVIDSAKEAVSLAIAMLGVVAMWSGIMRIAELSGLVAGLTRKMAPALLKLFPELDKKNKALRYISLNVIANLLGLGWAATPAGLKAMEELQKINPDKSRASKSMCMFLIFNMSSLQIVSINIVAYRSEFNSANPAEIIGPGLLATLVSTAAGITAAKVFEKIYDRRARRYL